MALNARERACAEVAAGAFVFRGRDVADRAEVRQERVTHLVWMLRLLSARGYAKRAGVVYIPEGTAEAFRHGFSRRICSSARCCFEVRDLSRAQAGPAAKFAFVALDFASLGNDVSILNVEYKSNCVE